MNEINKESDNISEIERTGEPSKKEIAHSEKLVFTGRIAAGIAHEIRNPLTNVSMALQQLKKDINSKEHRNKDIEIIEKNIDRISHLITELLNCARPPKLNIQPYDIHKILESVLGICKIKITSQNIKVIKKFTSNQSILKMDPEQIERGFLNIIINAIDAMSRGGKLFIETELKEGFFVIKIQDTGKGIGEGDIMNIFDPFFSTKSGGIGLGLTLCYGIIVSHGGIIEVKSKPREGSIFIVSLPVEKKE